MNYRIITTNELYHHGIKGQKWGVRRAKWYPLDPSQRSAAEKKAVKSSKKSTNNSGNESVSSKKKGLSDKQKKVIRNVAIGTAATVAIAAGLAYTAKNPQKVKDLISKIDKKAQDVKYSDAGLKGQQYIDRLKGMSKQEATDKYNYSREIQGKYFGKSKDHVDWNRLNKLYKDPSSIESIKRYSSNLESGRATVKGGSGYGTESRIHKAITKANSIKESIKSTPSKVRSNVSNVTKIKTNIKKTSPTTKSKTKSIIGKTSKSLMKNLMKNPNNYVKFGSYAVDQMTKHKKSNEKSNGKSLNQYTMKDLRDLDLY